MRRNMLRSVSLSLASMMMLLVFGSAALAGPPLICHPFEIGNAKSLPWGGTNWRAVDQSYDRNRLAQDTLALLTPETPVLVRMETLRRATVIALLPSADVKYNSPVKNPKIAAEVLARLKARVSTAGKSSALAMFDYGYLVEAYKQAGDGSQGPQIAGGVDGYGLITKAIAMRGGDPAMEFAAALACSDRRSHGRLEYVAHLQRSAAGAQEGSLLARNLITHFGDKGKTLDEIRANAGKE